MSSMRSILWLLFATLAALAANFAILRCTPSPRSAKSLSLFDPSFSPTKVSIERSGHPRTVLVRDGRWRIVAPYSGTADGHTVMKLVDSLVFASADDAISHAELLRLGRTPDDFRLGEPDLSVTLDDGLTSVRIAFGCLTPSSNGVYAAVSGSDSVLVLPAAVRIAADVDAAVFRERDIFAFGPEAVASFTLKRAGGGVMEFVRDGGGWSLGGSAASTAKVMEILSRVSGLKAVDFVWPVGADNEASAVSAPLLSGYGLDPETATTLTMHCTDGTDVSVSIGNDAGGRKAYALVRGGREIVTVDSALKDLSMQDAIRFTDARLFPLAEADVMTFTLASGDTSCVIARAEDGSWRMDAPVVAPAEAEAAKELRGRILTLTSADIAEKGLRVSVNTNSAPSVVSPASVLGSRRIESLRSLEVIKLDPALVKRIVSTFGGRSTKKPVSVVKVRDRRAWNVEASDVGGSVDEDGVERVLGAIASLRAARVVALKAEPSDLARYGLEHPFHMISVDQEKEGSVRRNIMIGGMTGGGRYATVGSSDAIFVLPEKTVSALLSPLVSD